MSCRLLSRLHNCVDSLCIQMCIFLFDFSKVNINIIFLKRQTLVHVCICPYYLLVEEQIWPVQTGRQLVPVFFSTYLSFLTEIQLVLLELCKLCCLRIVSLTLQRWLNQWWELRCSFKPRAEGGSVRETCLEKNLLQLHGSEIVS